MNLGHDCGVDIVFVSLERSSVVLSTSSWSSGFHEGGVVFDLCIRFLNFVKIFMHPMAEQQHNLVKIPKIKVERKC